MDNARLKAKLADASRHLSDATSELDSTMRALSNVASVAGDAAGTALSLGGVSRNLGAAASSFGEIDRLLDGDEGSAPMRDCPHCGKRIVAAATLCGFCWSKLTAVSG